MVINNLTIRKIKRDDISDVINLIKMELYPELSDNFIKMDNSKIIFKICLDICYVN